MRYDFKYPNGVVYEFTLEEIIRDARAGKVSEHCLVRQLGTQEYKPVSTLLGPCPSPQAECYVNTEGQRQGPFFPEQLRSMWRSGSVTAAAMVSWVGHDDPIKLSALMDNPLFNPSTPVVGSSGDRKTIAAILAVVGIMLVLYAVMRLNSIESQIIRGMGKSDDLSTLLLVGGIPAALIGIYLFFAPPASK